MIRAPAMIGSDLLMLVLFGWMGRGEAPVLLFWLSGSLVVMTRVGGGGLCSAWSARAGA
jgi:hypothetical protein